MELTRDELAGIAGLFGGLTPEEFRRACSEVVFKETGRAPADAAVDERVAAALESYHLVSISGDGEDLLVPGPASFPAIPVGAEDLPHILEVDRRDVERREVAAQVVTDAIAELEDDPDETRREQLRQLSYDLETWVAVDAEPIRALADDLEE